VSQELPLSSEDQTPSYDSSAEQVQLLTDQLLQKYSERLPGAESRRYVAIEVPGTSLYANIGRHIERTVFEESFGNDAERMAKEYGAYEQASTFFISIDQVTKHATGALRTIANSEEGLKSWDDATEHFGLDVDKALQHQGLKDLDMIWDVGTIAVLPEFREKAGSVSILLERAMYLSAQAHKVQSLISIVDDGPLVKMRSTWRGVGIPFKPLPGTKAQPYLGSKKSHAVYGYVPDFYEKMSHHRESFRGRMIAKYVLGDALDRLVEGTADEAIILQSL
jgi:hypothetical protein